MSRPNKPRKMDEKTLSAHMKTLVEDAEDYSEQLGVRRMAATDAYNGEEYGNEQEGRSKLVTREVRDTIRMAMPSVMRIMFGTERVVEYKGTHPEDVEPAKQATEYMNYVVRHDNDGYREFSSAFEDALVRRTGVFKVWWAEEEKLRRSKYTGLTLDQANLLASADEVESVTIEETGDAAPAEVNPDGEDAGQQSPAQPEPLFDAVVVRREKQGKLRFEAIPPEEYIITSTARSRLTATLVGHRRNVTLSDLMEMGYDEETVWNLSGDEDEDLELERDNRAVEQDAIQGDDDAESLDPSQREVVYAECWVRVDYDGDGIAELRRICVAGGDYQILHNELADEVMLVDLCPLPVAHQAIGHSLAELVEDIQKIKTMVLRNTMDSLASSIHPDTVAVEGQVNFDDLLNTEQGRIIRQKQPGMLEYKTMPFVGKEAFGLLEYLDGMRESRTGLNQASQGLDADALQSTSNVAIDAAVQSAQAQIELITRTLIETGVKPLFKLMLKLSVENADRKRHIRLSNQFIEVDPRGWNADMDVTTNVALGAGSMEQRMQQLNMLATKQELIMQSVGPDNPIAGPEEYRNTLVEMAKLGGIVDVDRFLKDPTRPENQPKPKQPQPDPNLILAQAEVQKNKDSAEQKAREFQLNVWKAVQEDDRKRDELIANTMLKAADSKGRVDLEQIRHQIERDRQQDDMLMGLLREGNAREANQQQAELQREAAARQQAQQGNAPGASQ